MTYGNPGISGFAFQNKNLHTEMAVFDKYLILTNLEFFFLFSFGFVFLREGTCVLLGWVGAE